MQAEYDLSTLEVKRYGIEPERYKEAADKFRALRRKIPAESRKEIEHLLNGAHANSYAATAPDEQVDDCIGQPVDGVRELRLTGLVSQLEEEVSECWGGSILNLLTNFGVAIIPSPDVVRAVNHLGLWPSERLTNTERDAARFVLSVLKFAKDYLDIHTPEQLRRFGLELQHLLDGESRKRDLVQIINPKTERYVKIDRSVGAILAHKRSEGPYKNIPIAKSKRTVIDGDVKPLSPGENHAHRKASRAGSHRRTAG